MTREELLEMAELAKFALNESEINTLLGEIDEIIALIGGPLSAAADTGGRAGQEDEEYPLREDIAMPSLLREDVLSGTPDTPGGYIAARGI